MSTDNSGVKPPCNHEPWNPTLIIHPDGHTEVTCSVCGKVVPYKESAARPPREFWIRNLPLNAIDRKKWRDQIDENLSHPGWIGTAMTGNREMGERDGIRVIEFEAYQSLLAERDALRKSQADRMVQAAGTLSTLAVERDQLLAQAEALAGALERLKSYDHLRDSGHGWVDDALTAWHKFKEGKS